MLKLDVALTNESQWYREIVRHSSTNLGWVLECLVETGELSSLSPLPCLLVQLFLRRRAPVLLLLQ